MRKKTISHFFDTLFWYLLYALPFLIYGIVAIKGDVSALNTFLTANFGAFTDNIIFTTLSDLFGSTGVFTLFTDTSIIYLCTWFVSVFILHLAVDFVLFIPRLAHNFMDCFGGSKNEK